MRVKVMKPAEEEESEIVDPMDASFGLKNIETKDELVLEPEPAVPGRPVFNPETVTKFEEFLPSSTSPPALIPVNNIKTVDFQDKEVSESDYAIYDYTDDVQQAPEKGVTPSTQSSFMSNMAMDMNDFSKMPIFNNFPMMAPHEFINLIAAEEIKKLDSEEMFNKNSFSAF